MTAPAETAVYRIAARLVKSPTNLAGSFPTYGSGTQLGAVRDIDFHLEYDSAEVEAEEFGGETVETIQGPFRFLFAETVFRALQDADALAAIFPGTSAGKLIIPPTAAADKPGLLGSGRSFVLLVVAEDVANKDSVLVYKAIPSIVPDPMRHAVLKEAEFRVRFRGIRDSSGRVFQKDLLSGLSL